MRTTDRIGFKLIIKEPDTDERTVIVCPRYEGLKLRWNKQSGKVYHNMDIEGNVTLTGVDFRTVNACPLRTKFTLVVFYKGKGEVARSEFRKTDCKWDIDHETCEVDVSVWDEYSKLEDGRDNEYNLVKILSEKKTLGMRVFPQNQIYFQDDDLITLFGISQYGSQPAVSPNHDHVKLSESMNFTDTPTIMALVKVEGDSDFEGVFCGIYPEDGTETHTNFGYGGIMSCVSLTKISGGGTKNVYFCKGEGYPNTYKASQFCLGFPQYGGDLVGYQATHKMINSLYSLTSATVSVMKSAIQTVDLQITSRIYVVYSGMVTMTDMAGLEIPNDDITADFNHNYINRDPLLPELSDVASVIKISSRTSATDKGYGRVENTSRYYDTPDDNNQWLPVRKPSWFEGYSAWVKPLPISNRQQSYYSENLQVSDFYALGDAIKAVLNEIDPSIVFEPDTTHSQFLFSPTNPVSGKSQKPLYISQKSNVLNLGYDYPAWLAPITFGKIETLLKNAFGCCYDLFEPNGDGVKHLRIEHLTFYMNGGYGSSNVQSANIKLDEIYHAGTNNTFADKTNKWEWDTDGGGLHSSANRYEYGWMDTQSAIFDGYPIVVPEEYRLFEGEQAEERKVDWFSSDIDFLTSVQAECSSDGFVIVMEDFSNEGWVIRGNPKYSGQNYEMSLEYLQEKYLKQGIYAEKIQIGDGQIQSNAVMARMRKGEVSFALPDRVWCEASDIIRTAAGNATIDTLTFDFHSEQWTATIRYNNE